MTSAIENTQKNTINPTRSLSKRLEKEDIIILEGIESSKIQYYTSIIRPQDIEKNVASHPAVLTGIFYTRAWITLDESNDSSIGIGLSYNYSHNNSAINYKQAWVWGSISF